MIIIRTSLKALPEKQKEVLQTLLSMLEPPENGNGLLNYGIYHDIEKNNTFDLISEWKTREHLDHHLCSERFGVLLGTKSLLCKPIEIQIITVSSVEGVEAVRTARKKES
jgi:quinol monooxygenase YgiN